MALVYIHASFSIYDLGGTVATNTGKGYRKGQQKDRYQQENLLTKLFDLFDGNGNYLRTKKSKGKFKGVETRKAKKPPRR